MLLFHLRHEEFCNYVYTWPLVINAITSFVATACILLIAYFACDYFTAHLSWLLLINVIPSLLWCFLSSFSSAYQHLHNWQHFTNLIILPLCVHEKFSFHKSLSVSFQFSTHSFTNHFSKEFHQFSSEHYLTQLVVMFHPSGRWAK